VEKFSVSLSGVLCGDESLYMIDDELSTTPPPQRIGLFEQMLIGPGLFSGYTFNFDNNGKYDFKKKNQTA